jgi:hypothetical protein
MRKATADAWQISGYVYTKNQAPGFCLTKLIRNSALNSQVTNWIETAVNRTPPDGDQLSTQVREREFADQYHIASLY